VFQWTNIFGFARYSPFFVILIWVCRPQNEILCVSSDFTEIWIILQVILQLLQLFVLRKEIERKKKALLQMLVNLFKY